MTFDLVLQGPTLTAAIADEVRTLVNGAASANDQALGPNWRIFGVDRAMRGQVAEYCAPRAIDFAFVPAGRRWSDIGLIAMDMDSTLITIECIDEIADHVGKKQEVAAVTERAMRGEIDWPESLHQRVALLAGLDAAALDEVYGQRLRLTPGAEDLVAFAKLRGIKLLLVSGGFTFFTDRLKARLGLDYAHSNLLEIVGGKLTGRVTGPLCDAKAKAHHLAATRDALQLETHQTVAIGDGANDLSMMAAAGYSIAFHAKPKVRDAADSAINFGDLSITLPLFLD